MTHKKNKNFITKISYTRLQNKEIHVILIITCISCNKLHKKVTLNKCLHADVCILPIWLTELFIVSVVILSFGDKMTSLSCPPFFKLLGEPKSSK